jgi:hypothetical protein
MHYFGTLVQVHPHEVRNNIIHPFRIKSYQKFRVSQTTRLYMPSVSYYKQTRRPLKLPWEEELGDTLTSLSMKHLNPLSHQQMKTTQSYGLTQNPQGEHCPMHLVTAK